jgi:hypothetical protein
MIDRLRFYLPVATLLAERRVLLVAADFVEVARIACAKSIAAFAYSTRSLESKRWSIWRMFVLTTSGFTSPLDIGPGFGIGFPPGGLFNGLKGSVGSLGVGGLA